MLRKPLLLAGVLDDDDVGECREVGDHDAEAVLEVAHRRQPPAGVRQRLQPGGGWGPGSGDAVALQKVVIDDDVPPSILLAAVRVEHVAVDDFHRDEADSSSGQVGIDHQSIAVELRGQRGRLEVDKRTCVMS